MYTDTFEPRPFQADVVEAVVDGFAANRRSTIALGSPGTGKTLAYQATAVRLLREGLIDHVAVFAPRVNLAQQCELDWMHRDKDTKELLGHFRLFDAKSRFGKIRHSDASPPLTEYGSVGTGFASTYAALTGASSSVFTDWAEEHSGRFLLVADEAQFCGSDDGVGEGTRAGVFIEKMHEHAAHTLLLTGTPYRADGQRLVIADYTDPDESGKQQLIRHVEATYADGIDGEYLRRFEMQMQQGTVRETDTDHQRSVEYQLSDMKANLQPVLRMPTTWQPLADLVVRSVREKQILNPAYRGLISCMEKQDASAVTNYLRSQYPGLRVHLAISSDGAAARKALQDFKEQPADVLVTVRMAFIGYDCKQITVVGVLTHYRDKGHLMQLIGRGLRVWDEEPFDEQTCHIIAPDDEKMNQFLDWLQEQQDEGIRRRQEREGDLGDSTGDDVDLARSSYIEATQMTTVRAVSNDAEVDHEERSFIESAKRQFGIVGDVTKIQGFVDAINARTRVTPNEGAPLEFPQSAPTQKAALTDKQQITEWNRQTAAEIRAHLTDRQVTAGHPEYSLFVGKVTKSVNRIAGVSSKDVRTPEQAERRLRAARSIRGRA